MASTSPSRFLRNSSSFLLTCGAPQLAELLQGTWDPWRAQLYTFALTQILSKPMLLHLVHGEYPQVCLDALIRTFAYALLSQLYLSACENFLSLQAIASCSQVKAARLHRGNALRITGKEACL
jgi:hypothetical protein